MRCCSTRPSPGSPATSRSSATPRTPTSVGHVRSGSSPTPSTPSTCVAATQHPAAAPGSRGEPRRAPHPRRPGRRPRQGTGAVSIEKLGAATTQLLTDWLTRFAAAGTKVNLRPVLDLTRRRGPARPTRAMRETVVLRDAHCVFPGCSRDSRTCDLDHITHTSRSRTADHPAKRAPPISPPCAGPHHRLKTHTAWDYKTPRRPRLPLDRAHRTPVHGLHLPPVVRPLGLV